MKHQAVNYYNNGYNCSQCILKAAERTFKVPISKQGVKMCAAVCSGFGVGQMCSCLIAGIMIFGLLFDESTSKRLRMKLLNGFNQKYPNFNCSILKKNSDEDICEQIVADIAELVEIIVTEELNN